jgi:hypothetical protein
MSPFPGPEIEAPHRGAPGPAGLLPSPLLFEACRQWPGYVILLTEPGSLVAFANEALEAAFAPGSLPGLAFANTPPGRWPALRAAVAETARTGQPQEAVAVPLPGPGSDPASDLAT